MQVDHFGYAVKNVHKSVDCFKRLGYVFDKIIEDRDRNIYICFGANGNCIVELISTINDSEPSPVKNILKKNGCTPYHICYKTSNLSEEIVSLKRSGFIVVIPPRPAIAFNNKQVCFLMNLNVGLIEVVEE